MTDAWDGRPQNPERDGWHWLQRRTGGMPEAWLWTQDGEDYFHWHEDGDGDAESMARWFRYLGPCLTPSEVAAQVAAARREGIEACIAEHAAAAIRLAGDTFMAGYEECWARALRHKLLPGDAALARDFAAWTEGESDG